MQIILNVLQFVGILLLVLLVFNVIILAHEWGHFLAARWRKLQVDKFQIWFGKPIWKKTVNGVQYGLGSIPAGGFVALPQMAPMELLEGKSDEGGKKLEPISPLDKIIVAFAGPLFSFLLAVLFAVIVWMVGYPVSRASNSTTIGAVMHEQGGDKGGLRVGDEILSIDGKTVNTFGGMVDSVMWAVISSEEDVIPFKIKRDGELMTLDVPVDKPRADPDAPRWQQLLKRPGLRSVGIAPKSTPVLIGEPMENSPADLAGFQEGDELVAMNGEPILNFAAISTEVERKGAEKMSFTVLRDGQQLQIEATPQVPDKPGSRDPEKLGPILGLHPLADHERADEAKDTILKHPAPATQVADTFEIIYNTISSVFFKPKSDLGPSQLSGPVGIMNLYYRLFQSPDGWRLVLWFSVVLNINLAILNLLPLPILDGGHILMALIEGGLRRPINLRVLEVVNAGCAILLIGFMLYVTVFDTGDIFSGNGGEKYVPPSFDPPPSAQS